MSFSKLEAGKVDFMSDLNDECRQYLVESCQHVSPINLLLTRIDLSSGLRETKIDSKDINPYAPVSNDRVRTLGGMHQLGLAMEVCRVIVFLEIY